MKFILLVFIIEYLTSSKLKHLERELIELEPIDSTLELVSESTQKKKQKFICEKEVLISYGLQGLNEP